MSKSIKSKQNSATNTDEEIWRKTPDDYYSPSIHVTRDGQIGINVGGQVIIAPIEAWHEAGRIIFRKMRS